MSGSRQISASPAEGTRLLQASAQSVLRACDLLFGSFTIVMSVIAFVLVGTGGSHLDTALAVTAVPTFNLGWSLLTLHRERVRSDMVRAIVCLPLTAYIYVAETGGMLHELWIPALLVCLGATLSVSIATRRSLLGVGISIAYGAALVVASVVAAPRVSPEMINDALAISLVGAITAMVASRFGRTLEEVRRVHVELHQAQKLESVGRLAAGIAHEINTPVQFVSDSVEFVRSAVVDLLDIAAKADVDEATSEATDLPYIRAEVPKALDLAMEGLGRVTKIVRSMKEFAHPDAREMALADLNRAIVSTLTMANNEYKYVADLVTELGEIPPVRCHVGQLNQVVLNLVVNAAHAIGDMVAGTKKRGRIDVKTYSDGDEVVISVADTGGGIADGIGTQVFEPFFTTKDVGKGTGQGLAIARSVVVDKHRGSLEFETEEGRGTTFYIRVPIGGVPLAIAA